VWIIANVISPLQVIEKDVERGSFGEAELVGVLLVMSGWGG